MTTPRLFSVLEKNKRSVNLVWTHAMLMWTSGFLRLYQKCASECWFSVDCRGFRSTWKLLHLHLMVPASSGLKAYSQSCISLSLVACSSIPLCSVHTANVLGVWGCNKKIQIQKSYLYAGANAYDLVGPKAVFTRSRVCLSSLYSTLADDRLMTARSTLSLSLRYR